MFVWPRRRRPLEQPRTMGKVKGAKAAERRRQKLLATQAAKRVEESIAKANAIMDNPLDGLDPFLCFDLCPKKPAHSVADLAVVLSPSSSADTPEVVDKDDTQEEDKAEEPNNSISARVSFHSSPLPTDLHDACLNLFEGNMADLYRDSSWGLDLDEKSEELRHETARFLIVERADNGTSTNASTDTAGKRDVLAFSHFRFEPNDEDKPTDEVLYVYEIQVSDAAQRSGLGKRMMNIMELVAMKQGMKKIMLTVFKNNEGAMSFYLNRMKYAIDETSPSNFEGESADYEILSKAIPQKKR